MDLMKKLPLLIACVLFGSPVFAENTELPPPVRIDSDVSGHIHPALCITRKGTLVAVFQAGRWRITAPISSFPRDRISAKTTSAA